MQAIQLMELVTLAVTLLMFMSGISPMLQMYRTRDTRNVPFVIFLLTAISCSGMLHYGLMMDNAILIFLNAIGTMLQWTYVLLYLLLIEDKGLPMLYLCMGLSYMAALYYYMYQILVDDLSVMETIGSASSMLTTIIVSLPSLEIVNNIRYKNTDGMPAVMLVGGFACSLCWLVYGLMLDDANVYRPNIPGILITSAKLYIIFIYSKSGKHKTA